MPPRTHHRIESISHLTELKTFHQRGGARQLAKKQRKLQTQGENVNHHSFLSMVLILKCQPRKKYRVKEEEDEQVTAFVAQYLDFDPS